MYFTLIFGFFCLACTVLAFRRHPIYGFYFYMATTFVYPQGRYWGHFFADFRPALLSAGITILAIAFHSGKLKPRPFWLMNPPAVILSVYCAWLWLQTPWALAMTDHLEGSTLFAKSLVAFWMVYRVTDSRDRLRDLLVAYVLGCAILGIMAQSMGRVGGRLDGVGGPGIDDANTLGMYLATGVVLAVGLTIAQRGWLRYLAVASLVVIANGIVLANSRGSVIGLLAGGLVLGLIQARQHRRSFWALIAAAVVGQTLIIDQTFINRMFTIKDVTAQQDDNDADASARSRSALAETQLEMFRDHPMGVGHRGTAVLSPEYLDDKWLTGSEDGTRARSSHSSFLTALVEQGVIGALLYLGLVLWILFAAYRIRRLRDTVPDPNVSTLGASVCASLVVILVSGLTADYLLAENQFWFLGALVSMLGLVAQPERTGRVTDAGGQHIGMSA